MSHPNPILQAIEERRTTNLFDPARGIDDERIEELVRLATTAPTSFNLQNWRFVAVRTPERKARLRALAWDQAKVSEAAVTFIVCGQLADHRAAVPFPFVAQQGLTDMQDIARAAEDFRHHAVIGRGNIHDGLGGFHRYQQLVGLDRLASLDMPLDDLSFLQPLAQIRQFEILHRHLLVPPAPREWGLRAQA